MTINANPSFNVTPITASTLIKSTDGVIGRIVVASTTVGTLTIYDNTSATGKKILDTITPAAAQTITLEAAFSLGCYIVVGGTISASVMWI